jgi:DNA helicase-2/ATP-dependent DNA helicase PcrA
MTELAASRQWGADIERLRRWYDAIVELRYDAARLRLADLDQLAQMAMRHPSRAAFLTDLTLDPPEASGAEAGAPLKDEDWLTLSTIHSAKGQEWRAVLLLNVVDGCIPSDMATGTPQEIEEERRLLYVAMTRARDSLYLLQPHRFYTRGRPDGDFHVYVPRTRFIPGELGALFERQVRGGRPVGETGTGASVVGVDVGARLRDMW